jgi:lysophospholipase L1-like esterase
MTSGRSHLRALRWAMAPSVALAALVTEVLWVAHRPLPSFAGLDASGTIPTTSSGGGPLELAAGEPLTIVALGDSTLTGPGLSAAGHVWVRAALAQLDHPIEYVSLAVGGSRVADVLQQVDTAIDREPDLVVVAVGANDAIHGTPRRVFRRRFEELVGRLADGVPTVAVANIGDLGNIARVPSPLRSVLRWRSAATCSIIESVVADRDSVELLDVTSADRVFRDRSVFTADLFHPGPVGHAAWAEAALPGLRRAVSRSFARLDAPPAPRRPRFA